MVLSVLICLCHDPGWTVGNATVEDFARCLKVIEAVHYLRHRCRVIPPVKIEDVDVVRLKPFQRVFQSKLQSLDAISSIVNTNLDIWVRSPMVQCIWWSGRLSRDSCCHSLANQGLGLSTLITIGGVDEHTILFEVMVKNIKSSLLGAFSEHRFVGVSKIQSAQA